jgi:hypothetical protein
MHKVRTNPPRSKEPYPTIPPHSIHPSMNVKHISWHGIQMQWNDSTPCVDAAPVWWTVKINTQVNLQTWSLQYRAWVGCGFGWDEVVWLDWMDLTFWFWRWLEFSPFLWFVWIGKRNRDGTYTYTRVLLEDPFHYMRCQPVVVSLSKWLSPIEWREEGNEAREEEPLPSSLLAYILHKYSRCRKHIRPWTARLSDALWNSLSVLFCSRVLKNHVSLLFCLFESIGGWCVIWRSRVRLELSTWNWRLYRMANNMQWIGTWPHLKTFHLSKFSIGAWSWSVLEN